MALSVDDVAGVRAGLDAGRRPRVVFTASAGQIAGQVGQVVALRDPAESDDWVTVRFGRDELPFSPGDLAIAPRGVAARKPAPAAVPAPVATPEPEFVIDKPVAAPPPPPVVPPPRRTAPRPGKPKPLSGLTVTLTYERGEWTVAAAQGAKVLAKPYLVRPAEAMRMVALVDVPGVREAVEQIVAAERAEVEKEAERLRTELAEVEARLAELREAG